MRSVDFLPLYRAALQEHLEATGEGALHRAYEIGRAALSTGTLGVVDLILLHHEILPGLIQAGAHKDGQALAAAAVFLAETLAPFEMMLRGYRDTNARLTTANIDLERANAAVAAAHMALKAEAAERQQLNQELEQRVRTRTSELEEANAHLRDEVALRVRADGRLQTQLERTNLLNEIVRVLNERLDLSSLFKIVVRALETQLPVDFAAVCLYDAAEKSFSISEIGAKARVIAGAIAVTEGARIEVDEDGLSRCVRGELVYEPDISSVRFPFPNRLAGGGLKALVIAPLKFEDKVFGALLAARTAPDSFSSSDCEFLMRLGTHVALAAQQAQLYTSLQRAYDDLRQTQQAVIQQERLRVLGQMASGIAHDINNVISPLSLTTQSLLETEPDMSARIRNFLEAVKRVVNDIAATVSRMREFYRQRDDQGTPRAIDFNELAQQTIELTQARWSDMPQQRGVVVQLHTVLDPNLPKAAGLESEIREALTNLIFNAVDAMPNGGRISVGTGTRTRAGVPGEEAPPIIFIEVTDTGIGMDEETRRHCLEPFFTTKGERGTGLGLAMVYGAMKRQSGDIEIESAVGKGTTIRLLLPEAPATSAKVEEIAATDPPPSLKLLLIDDDPFILDSLRMVLELDGHRVSTADGGAAGLELLKAAAGEPFQAVFTDLGMPGMDGRAVARAIKAIAPDTPVILLTGWGERLGGQNLSAGINCVLAKPPEPDDLRKALLYCTRAG